ncbi:unnamed protein product, partial [marine sediment metagenome]
LYVAGGASSSRFRVPVEPYLALLAAEGICTGVLWLKARRTHLALNLAFALGGASS